MLSSHQAKESRGAGCEGADTAANPCETSDVEGFVSRPIERWSHGETSHENDLVAEEIPVALRYNGVPFAVMMATPHDLEDFALGFSLSEGLISDPGQLLQFSQHPLLEGIELDLRVADDAPVTRRNGDTERSLPGRSGCGICGSRELEQVIVSHPPVGDGVHLTRQALECALAELQTKQPMNAATGAMHAAAWATPDGKVHLVREDVGRHNALDKLIGALRSAHVPAETGIALITSRASYEMVNKAASAGISILVAISAPTALAIDMARSAGMTLIGFSKPGRHNVYSHAHRLDEAASS